MLSIENLQVKFQDKLVLDIDRKIEIKKGDKIGIVGSNGAGKTTLINTILGLNDYTGSIKTDLKDEEVVTHMQFNEFVDTMSIKNVMEAILNTSIKTNKKLMDLIEDFDMKEHLNKKYKVLSGGQKQRFTLIMVLYKEGKLTFFDEVTTGLDFESRQKLMEKIKSWYNNEEDTVCLVTHYYEELEQLVDKILLLDKGHVIDFDYKDVLFNKYCGRALIVVENNEFSQKVLNSYKKISSPNHLIALPVLNEEEELKVINKLVENDIDFRRTTNDIEIMTINAKEMFYKNGGIKND